MRYLVILLLFPVVLFAESSVDVAPTKKVLVHNRVLAHVNGKAISVIDLQKRMDMLLFQNYPQYLDVPEARFQFYTTNWRRMLSEWIDRELVLADAEEKKFEVSAGDVREELEDIFGPNMMHNLDSAGLSFDEAFTMLKEEITLRRMLYMQVRARVYATVGPSDIRLAYDQYVQNKAGSTSCTWSAVTIKSKDVQIAEQFAQKLYDIVQKEVVAPEQVLTELERREMNCPDVTVTVSSPFQQSAQELASTLRDIFSSLPVGSYSAPQRQKSKTGLGDTVRLYFLHERTDGKVASIEEMEAELLDDLRQKEMQKKTDLYFTELERHFHSTKEEIEGSLGQNMQLFELK